MRISELSSESGISVPTIKFYLREGLLRPGERSGPNQADYGEEHVHRLRLIRALAEVGDLPIAAIRQILTAIDDPSRSMHGVLGVAHHALGPRRNAGESSQELKDARADVDRFLGGLGWRVSANAPGRDELANALAVLRRLGWAVDARVFVRYARTADRLAAWELDQTPTDLSRARTVEAVVVGTVVFEAALVALRRLAQEHHSATRFPRGEAEASRGAASAGGRTAPR